MGIQQQTKHGNVNLAVEIPQGGSFFPFFLGLEFEFGLLIFSESSKPRSNPYKNTQNKEENQKQTQFTVKGNFDTSIIWVSLQLNSNI